jgi:hypothetical protein
MAFFQYRAADQAGKIIEGVLESREGNRGILE